MSDDPRDRIVIKIVLMGDGAVGKTSLRYRYMGKKFTGNYTMTIGADFALKKVNYNGRNYVAQIWDLSGQSMFSSVRKVYYMGAMGFLMVFSIERPETFRDLPKWLTEFIDTTGAIVPMVLIGNKGDLRDNYDGTIIPKESAEDYANALSEWSGYSVPYVETSALRGSNVDDAFLSLIRQIDEELYKDE